jgi:hypothetical protein
MRNSHGWGVRVALVCAVLLSMAAIAGTANAQTFRGTILGSVTDTTGAAITGAKVTVRNVDTGITRTTETNGEGEFNIPELQIGNYSVTVEKEGFQASVTTGVVVDVAGTKRVDTTLKPGQVSQSVTVTGETLPQVETTSDTLGGTLTADQVRDLPVNGRDYTKLIYLTPGISGSPDQITDSPGSLGVFSMNGARGRANNFLLDGTDMNDGYRNDPAINEAGVFGTPATILPIDAVSELRVLSNYEPEYGRNAGAVINIVTKSGTNKLHGSAIEYFRNNALDARNFFNTGGPGGQPQAPFHNNQFGGSVGGPIIKDKTFFFADYEGQRERVGVVSVACVPNPGSLVASNPVITSLLAHYPNNDPWPLPTPGGMSCGNGDGTNTSVIAPSFNRVDSLIAKIDHNFNASNILTGRYYFGDSDQAFPLALTGGGILPGFNTATPTRVQLVSLSYVRVLTPTKVNEVRFGWIRFAEGFFPQDQTFQPSSVGLCAASSTSLCTGASPANSGLPVIDVGGLAQLGASHSDPRSRVDTNWQALDNFSWKIGKHDIKFGYEYRRTSIAQFLGTNFRGTLKFASLASFLNGTVDSSGSESLGNSNRNTYQNNHGLYIQDSFRWTSRLTVNFGLRWDFFGVVTEKNNLFSNITNFDPIGQTVTLTQVGSPGLGSLYQPDYKNFAPRMSVAWDPFGTGKTVVRTGFGIFYDAFSQDFFLGHLPYNSGFDPGSAYNPFGPAGIFSVGLANGTPTTIMPGVPVFATPGTTPAGDIFAVDQHMRTPYMENYNVNLQQQLSSKVVLQVGYVGSEGHNLLRFRDLNQPSQGAIDAFDVNCGCTNMEVTRVFANNPYGATSINYQEASANSNYNALQASLHVNGWHGISSMLNYVWSHSLDNASDGEDFVPNAAQPNDSTNTRLEYGNSNFDIRNRFTWIFAYELPRMGGVWQRVKNGWGIDSTVTLQDGQPFNLNYNFESDFSGSFEGFDRPDVVGPIQYDSGNPGNFLNLSSFAIPCTANTATGSSADCVPGTRHFGDLGRNSLRGPSFKQWDFAIYKNTPITEWLNFQFRAEFFNILNHPNFANPLLPAFIADAAQQGFSPAISNGHEVSKGAYSIGATGDVGIGNPFLGGGGPRGIQLAATFRF